MLSTTIKGTLLALMLSSALPLAACGKSDTPTSPTQPGPPVATPEPTPAPPPAPEPTPAPPSDDNPIVSITGPVANLARSGAGDLDISFRIDDFTIVRASGSTPVMSGGSTFRTDAVRPNQTVTVDGHRNGAFLDATKITIIAQAP